MGGSIPNLRQFDYATISDVILHLNYTAREEGGNFKNRAVNHIKAFLADANREPLIRLFNLRHEFPNEWHQMKQNNFRLDLTLEKSKFPYLAQLRPININHLFLVTDGMIDSAPIVNETTLNMFELSGKGTLEEPVPISIIFTNPDPFTDQKPPNEAYLLVNYSL